jgi:transcriptional pleiotropic regulator of transition state genes
MKDTGIIRQIDELGRIVIPIEIRKRLAISERDPLEIYVKGERIILSKPVNQCVFCGKTRNLETFHEREVCASCRSELSGAGSVTLSATE